MKKALLITSILFVAVASTACINNLAVQDLNNKARVYMEKGDYTSAIERLKSSIDLDSSIFETHYNLAIAYTSAEDYINAIEEYKKSIEMKPDMADIYYSLATAQNNLAVDMEQGRVRMNIDDSLYSVNPDEVNFDEKYKLSEKEQNLVTELFDSAVQNYEKYLKLNPNAEDKDKVEDMITSITSPKEPQKISE